MSTDRSVFGQWTALPRARPPLVCRYRRRRPATVSGWGRESREPAVTDPGPSPIAQEPVGTELSAAAFQNRRAGWNNFQGRPLTDRRSRVIVYRESGSVAGLHR